MKSLKRFWIGLLNLTSRRSQEERIREEIEEHIELQTSENLRAGLSPAEAHRQAMLKFGSVEAVKEGYREQRGLPFLETLLMDTKYALRRLRKSPAFTGTVVLTLALGIGATTAIFTLVQAVLLKSLPVAKPDELYRLGTEFNCCYTGGYSQEKEFSLVSYDLYKYLRDNTKGFSELAAFPAVDLLFGVRRAGSTEAAQTYPGEFVSGNYFSMFGVGAYAGRTLTPDDDRLGAAPSAVMSYRLWQEKYGSDPAIVNSVFNVNDKPFTVVGIAPPTFFGDALRNEPPDFFIPLNMEPYVQTDSDLNKVNTHWLELIGRIQPTSAPAPVEAEMRVELKQWLRSHWQDMSANDRAKFPEQTLFLRPGGAGISSVRQQYEHWLQILMAVSSFVLLIVCCNVASLVLVRGMERRNQLSLSMALGAPPSRLVKQTLTESILLSLAGGAAGLAVAFVTTKLVLYLAFPRFGGEAGVPISASPSLPVLLFAFGVSLLTGILFGIVPAWSAARVDPIEALRGASRSTAPSGSLPRRAFVVFQAALSLVLLTASGLLTVALHKLENQNLGFDQDRRLVANLNARLAGYRTAQLPVLYRRIHDAMANLPGVSSVALCLYSPLSGGGWGAGVWVDGQPFPGPRDDNSAAWERVTAGYFDVIGTPILKGRGISDLDTASSRKVAVINEAFARKFFKGEDPIGKHFGRDGGASREFEIVGVAKDARYLRFTVDQPAAAMFFLPEAQAEYAQSNLGSLFLHDVVILAKPGASVSASSVHQAMASVDPNLPIVSIQSLREQVARQFNQQRLIARLTSLFGLLSLVLASIGLYGVTAYNAGRRTSEIGVRLALGASRAQTAVLILRGVFSLVAVGLVAGLPIALAAGPFLGSQLYGVKPYNASVLLLAVLTLGLAALAASLVPAIRATLVSPSESLRAE